MLHKLVWDCVNGSKIKRLTILSWGHGEYSLLHNLSKHDFLLHNSLL